ncbi:CopD family protein [Devosia alba]|uniref:CopD family protein n=1 Tax=Devosia alba TaxID=3152360 RepID=UPI0032678E0B
MIQDFAITWLKFIHVGAIALWSGGLIALPFLYRQRRGLQDEALHRLHAFTRFFYVVLVSPGAFAAIASGTALILLQGTYENWFSAKLVAVAAMTGLHILSGLMILKIFERTGRYPTVQFVLVVPLTLVVVSVILALVLGKPRLDWPAGLTTFFAPGALGEMAEPLIGGWI